MGVGFENFGECCLYLYRNHHLIFLSLPLFLRLCRRILAEAPCFDQGRFRLSRP